jgi:2-hydroxy-6-oxonona-2,4-dienedioate hydrolase
MSEQETRMATASTKTTEPAEFGEFRRAERNLWDKYDLQPEERLVSIDNGRIVRIHEIGSGEPVLFVHGTGGSGVYFAPLVRELVASFRCVLMDRPGWTLSSPIDYSAGDFGTIVSELQEELLTSLGIERAHLVGGSIGNLFALRLALNHPDRVGNVVLLGGLPAKGLIPPTFLRILRTPLGQVIVRVPQKPPMIRRQVAGLGHAKSLERGIIPAEYIDMKAAESRNTDALKNERGLVRSVVAGRGFQPGITLSENELDAIQAPALMVYGSDDPLGSEKLWSDFTASLPNGSLRLIADSGHLPWYDHPHDVGAHTRTHLQTPPTRSA